ncbi:MAG: hypothetical protein U0T74_13510 [Chitinophagales bacterium]
MQRCSFLYISVRKRPSAHRLPAGLRPLSGQKISAWVLSFSVWAVCLSVRVAPFSFRKQAGSSRAGSFSYGAAPFNAGVLSFSYGAAPFSAGVLSFSYRAAPAGSLWRAKSSGRHPSAGSEPDYEQVTRYRYTDTSPPAGCSARLTLHGKQ